MGEHTTYVGLDVHQEMINAALLRPFERAAVAWQVRHTATGVRRLAEQIRRRAEAPHDVVVCYEAGPCGYTLARELARHGLDCQVVAPSLIPVKPGERVKTDRRDARKLAELLRAGLLTEVQPPTEAEEAVRDLCRCREDAKEDERAAKHRLLKYLARHGQSYTGGRNWTVRHERWLRSLQWADPTAQQVYDHYLLAVTQAGERVKLLDGQLAAAAEHEPYREPVAVLRGFRGIDTVTALGLVAELYQVARFPTARALMAYVGLVPREYSSGSRVRRGGITKSGNGHVRRLLVEAAWHCRHRPAVSRELRRRREGLPAWAVELADHAMLRLYRRGSRLSLGGKPANVVTTAVARELAGFIWAALYTQWARSARGPRAAARARA